MKHKDYLLSAVLFGFMGYLWVLFTNHVFHISDQISFGTFASIILFIIGFLLFGSIIKRLSPLNHFKLNHPVNLVGFASLLIVVAINLTAFQSF
ncbi:MULTISPECIES: hypothetical protein [Bacillaceae]|uniref:Uncharacterized protein n=1 Tax=Evansella alkalicola TaxID=745819 RepID=A0ABS6JS18_9BACI|nr:MULTISPECIES: hypothetical protein [Bacillaceae]MBU9721355.1 hypothetical protein [Bacillus alkalicola]